MSTNQKEQAAWAFRIVTLALLGISSTVGLTIYHKVDELYSEMKVQRYKYESLERSYLQVRQDQKELSLEVDHIKGKYYEVKSEINKITMMP